MTRLWSDGTPIQVMAGDGDVPLRFTWQRRVHEVDAITRSWRVRTDWWHEESWHEESWHEESRHEESRHGSVWRAYYRLTTTSGLLVVIYRDLAGGGWFLQRLFD